MRAPILRPRVTRLLLPLLLMLFAASHCSKSEGEQVEKPVDYIMIVDTSGSMSHPVDIMAKVRESLPRLLRTFVEGDRVSLLSFNGVVRNHGLFEIRSEGDRARIQAEVDAMVADGNHTDMWRMLNALRDEARQLQSGERQQIFIVLSDGIDDPAPGSRAERVELDSFREGRADGVSDPYIYYVSLGPLRDTALEKDLAEISPQVRTVESRERRQATSTATGNGRSDTDGATASRSAPGSSAVTTAETAEAIGFDAIARDIESVRGLDEPPSAQEPSALARAWKSIRSFVVDTLSVPRFIILIALVLIVMLLILALLMREGHGGAAFHGNLVYWNTTMGKAMRETFSLGKIEKSKLRIGSKKPADIKIRDIGFKEDLIMKAGLKKGEPVLKPRGKSSGLLKFIQQKENGVISPGDIFEVGNYTFSYGEPKEKKKKS